MIQLDPTKRSTAQDYISTFKDSPFPAFYHLVLHPTLSEFVYTINSFDSIDASLQYLFTEYDTIAINLNLIPKSILLKNSIINSAEACILNIIYLNDS